MFKRLLLLTVLALGLLAQETAFAAKHKKQSKKHKTSVSSSKKKKKSKHTSAYKKSAKRRKVLPMQRIAESIKNQDTEKALEFLPSNLLLIE